MAEKILYFLGAGASCEVVPLVKEFEKGLSLFVEQLERSGPKDDLYGAPKKANNPIWDSYRYDLTNATRWLIQGSSNHASIDTFAKKLFLKMDYNNLKKLKAVLSVFLIITQGQLPVDKRYDSFFASILKRVANKIKIPESISFLTWNYDNQLEKSFFDFCENDDDVMNELTLNKKNRLYRINGYCGTTQVGHIGDEFRAVWRLQGDELWEIGIKLYHEYMTDDVSDPDIRFAWEEYTNRALINSLTSLEDITILVIIGYSFPYFNREIDKIILNKLSNLKKIYLQYPEGEHNAIIDRMITLNSKLPENKVNITEQKLFHIPTEFEG